MLFNYSLPAILFIAALAKMKAFAKAGIMNYLTVLQRLMTKLKNLRIFATDSQIREITNSKWTKTNSSEKIIALTYKANDVIATDSQIREITNSKWTKSSASAKAMADKVGRQCKN